MTINELIRIASSHYEDGLIEQYWDFKNSRPKDTGAGDTLALFVTREIADTFDENADDRQKLENAGRAISNASGQLSSLARVLWDHE